MTEDIIQRKIADIIEEAIAPQYRAHPKYPRGIATYGEWLKVVIAKDVISCMEGLGYHKLEGISPLLTDDEIRDAKVTR